MAVDGHEFVMNARGWTLNMRVSKFIPIISSWIKWLIVIITCMIAADFAAQNIT